MIPTNDINTILGNRTSISNHTHVNCTGLPTGLPPKELKWYERFVQWVKAIFKRK